ncbi:uncharacterized protein LOC117536439 [Gymnodraco acuticeps]|uniref:Uncharacterized protein LOC117536439 n=1 Tax=Gymnodraco acuticeps TaxID=8218 RepID=A0A6P8T158_GYMAC|nr:uncharacterized protein LOC117536439 [Gymnodraco acuticeps]
MLADAMEEKVLQPTNLKGSRWLPYIHKATQILCNSYAIFVAHFEDQVSPERTTRPTPAVMGRAKNILHYLKSHTNVQFMHFLLDTLDFLKALSLQFQQDSLTPGEAVQYIEACLNGLTELCLEPGEQQRKMLADAMNGTYRGVELKNTTTDTLATDRKKITDMLTKHIESRLGDLLSTESIVQTFSDLDHNVWPKLDNSDESKEAFVLHGRANIESLCHHYQSILVREGTTVTEVLGEYRLYKIWARMRNGPLRDTLLEILQRGDLQTKFKNLGIFAQIYLTMAVSTAACERGFSCMKSDWRSSLSTQNLTRLMFLTVEGPSLDTFDAKRAVLQWWQSGSRARRPGFTAWSSGGRQNQPTEEENEEELRIEML